MQHQEIVLGVPGQSFHYDPSDGRPASSPPPSVQVHDGADEIAATDGDVTIDPVATELDRPAALGSRSLVLASTAGLATGVRYLLTNPNRDLEWIVVEGVSGNTVRTRHPLVRAYADRATLVGCRLSIAVADLWAGDRDNLSDRRRGLAGYRLRWTYTVDGFEMLGLGYADLVRQRSEQLVTAADIDARFPGWIETLPPEHRANRGADFIAEAVTAVRTEAIGDAHALRKVRDVEVLRELVKVRAHVIKLEHDVMHGNRRAAELEIAERRYRASYAKLVELPKAVAHEPPEPTAFAKGSEPGVRKRIPKLTKQ